MDFGVDVVAQEKVDYVFELGCFRGEDSYGADGLIGGCAYKMDELHEVEGEGRG